MPPAERKRGLRNRLVAAVSAGRDDAVLELEAAGAPWMVDPHDSDALFTAAAGSNGWVLRRALDAGGFRLVSVVVVSYLERRVLTVVDGPDTSANVDLLVAEGADINAATSKGMTALHWAAYQRRFDAVVALLAAGANPWLTAEPPKHHDGGPRRRADEMPFTQPYDTEQLSLLRGALAANDFAVRLAATKARVAWLRRGLAVAAWAAAHAGW